MDFTKTNDEKEIVVAIKDGIVIKEMSKEAFIDTIVKIKMLFGITKDYSNKEELVLAAQFVNSQFGYLTDKEIELAFMSYILNKYDTDIHFYGILSPFFISQILNSYLYYRKKTLQYVIREKEKYEEKILIESNKPPNDEICQSFKNIILDFWNSWEKNNCFSDPLSIAYKFFSEHKVLFNFKFDQKRIDAANLWAENKLKEDRKNKGFFTLKDDDESKQKIKYARVYCVMDFFSRHDSLEQITKKITPDLWS